MIEVNVDAKTGNVTITGDPPALTAFDVERIFQRHVDLTAGQRSYRSGDACASYKDSTVAKWSAEAAAFIAWRDAVWQAVYAMQDTPPEDIAAAIADLPEMEWPE